MAADVMPRIRSLKPEFAKDEILASLPRDVRLHYALLWTYADDDGRGLDNARLIKAELWPLDDDITPTTVDDWQRALEARGRIVRYEADGKRVFWIVHFCDHQHPQKKSESRLPPPPLPSESRNGTRTVREDSQPATGELSPVVVVVGEMEKEGSSLASASPDAEPPRRRDELFDAFAAELSYKPTTKTERGAWNQALKQLRDAGATPEQVHTACHRYRLEWPSVTLTVPAVAKHFGRLVNGAPQPRISQSTATAIEWAES